MPSVPHSSVGVCLPTNLPHHSPKPGSGVVFVCPSRKVCACDAKLSTCKIGEGDSASLQRLQRISVPLISQLVLLTPHRFGNNPALAPYFNIGFSQSVRLASFIFRLSSRISHLASRNSLPPSPSRPCISSSIIPYYLYVCVQVEK